MTYGEEIGMMRKPPLAPTMSLWHNQLHSHLTGKLVKIGANRGKGKVYIMWKGWEQREKADRASFDGECRGKQWVQSLSCSGGFDHQDGLQW